MAIPLNGPILRLLDANANRAREGLRVVEDYARFVLDDRELSRALKEIRHDLATILGPILAEAVLHRDTPGDVGTGNTTETESLREDVSDVVIAAGKRLGEAMRAIEEYLKVISAADAPRIEQLRYRFYDVEQRIALTLCPANRFANVRLYVLITERYCRRNWLETAEEALIGGADCLQLREKELDSGELLRRASQLVGLCRRHGKLCIINDRPDIAILSDADGVHVGQDDLPAVEVRKLSGRGKIVGVSTHRIEQAHRARLDGADYIGVGPIFPSATKPRDFVAGLGYAREVTAASPLPAVAIAGITAANVDEVLATGIRAIAVTAAVLDCEDPRAAAADLKRKLMAAGVLEQTVRQTLLSASAVADEHLVGQTFLSASAAEDGHLVGQTFLSAAGQRPASSGADNSVCDEKSLEVKRRRLPHWRLEGSTYFITFRILKGELGPREREIVLNHVKSGAGKFYTLIAATVMPDHVHVLLTPNANVDLSRITKGMKGASARLLNEYRGTTGRVWQDESWDRIMRDQDELDEKLEYMLLNPVKKRLVDDPWVYDGWYYNEEWQTGMSAPPGK